MKIYTLMMKGADYKMPKQTKEPIQQEEPKEEPQESSWNSYQVRTWAFWFMIIMVVILSFYLIWKTNDGSLKCLASPIPFGISQISSSNGQPITCTCSAQGSNEIIFFTKDNGTILNMQDRYLKP